MGRELDNIDLTAPQRKEITALLQRYLPDTEVWAYGSRVKFTARPSSDLDMVAFASKEQSPAAADLKEAFEESTLPFRVDLFVWDEVPEQFHKNIEEERVVLQRKKEQRGLPEGWEETTIGEFCPFTYGKNLPKKTRDDSGEVPVYGSNGVIGVHSKTFVNQAGIIIGRKGTIGSVKYSPRPFWPIDTTFYVIENEKKDLRYTFYLLKSIGLEHMNADSAVPGLNRDAAHARRILIPPLPEQKAIARILGSLDDKIELNRRMNETLEAMAQALFKSWFVDFDPVKARIAAKAKLPSPSGRGAGGEGKRIPPKLLKNARKLRQSATNAEKLMWGLLRGRQINNARFRRQHPMGQYILDFYCHDLKLAIELDGNQHNETEQKQYDDKRTAYLAQQGIKVLRFWNNQVLQETEAVLGAVYQATADLPSPLTPLPEGDGDTEHPSVILAAMCAISGKDETTLKQMQTDQPEAYKELTQIAALFPSELEHTEEMGWIPKGWIIRQIGKLLELAYGKALATKVRKPGPYPVYGSGGVGGYHKEHLVKGPGVIIGRKGTVGSVFWENGDFFPIDTVFFVEQLQEIPLYWIYQQLSSMDIASLGADSAVPGVNRNAVHAKKWVLPDSNIFKKYWDFFETKVEKMQRLKQQNRELSDLRDTLLPKLLSGGIRILEAEKLVKNSNRNGDQNG